MRTNSVLILASVAAMLIVAGIGNASAATFNNNQIAQLTNTTSIPTDFNANWVSASPESVSAQTNEILQASDTWEYMALKSETTDAIYSVYCTGLKNSAYVWNVHSGVLSKYGDGVGTPIRDYNMQAGTTTGTFSYQLSLGFYPQSEYYTVFANPDVADTLVVHY
jgi:hypothetical protein